MELILKGLGCANCAAKIEANVSKLKGVNMVSVDFISKTLKVDLKNAKEKEDILLSIKEIVSKIESDVIVEEKTKEMPIEEESNSKKKLWFILLGGLLFLLGTLLNFFEPIEFTILLTAYLLVGYDVVLKAIKNIFNGRLFDESFLMSVATIGAFSIGQFSEGVAVMLFYKIGEYLQEIAVNRSRKSITSLMDIRPDYANLKSGDNLKKVSPEDVSIGDLIQVLPGEKIPLDGIIVEGKSLLDTSALTGESVPREVGLDDEVLSGCINKSGLLTIKVTKEFGNSTVSKILELVQNASSRKTKTENFITKFARVYTPIVVVIAILIAVIPTIIISGAVFSDWLYRSLVFLVISCPCALVISIPLGFFGGVGGASKRGILVKGANFLEALNNVDTVVFDKTGTLTKGVFTVTEINPIDNLSKDELLEYAAYAESYSSHPIATSIVKEYGKEIDKTQIKDYNEISGHGIKVKIKDKEILAGNHKLMESEKIDYNLLEIAGTVVHLSVDKKYAGYIVISDVIKDDSKEAIAGLKAIGVRKTVMLTGDNKQIAENVAKQIKLDNFFAELLPHEKVEKLELLDNEKPKNKKLLFVGDGINDAPVLARADVGIAMGGVGSDAAIEAADIVIMTDEPSKIVTAIKIAKRTKNIVWQNITLAMLVKLIAMSFGVLGLATIWEAVIADVGVTIVAVLNAIRVLKVKNIQ
jgi:Cd2+/Zn2+-exporting ATPase